VDLGRGRQGSRIKSGEGENREAEKVYGTAINEFFVCFLSNTCLLSSVTLCDLTLQTIILNLPKWISRTMTKLSWGCPDPPMITRRSTPAESKCQLTPPRKTRCRRRPLHHPPSTETAPGESTRSASRTTPSESAATRSTAAASSWRRAPRVPWMPSNALPATATATSTGRTRRRAPS